MEACLINFNKGKDDEGCLKILQYSEMECNCVRKITEVLFRKYSTLWQHKCESLITVKNIIHLGQRPPKVWGPRLQPIEPIGKSGTVGYHYGPRSSSSYYIQWVCAMGNVSDAMYMSALRLGITDKCFIRFCHLHDLEIIISLKGEVWAHKTNFTPPHFIESKRSHLC